MSCKKSSLPAAARKAGVVLKRRPLPAIARSIVPPCDGMAIPKNLADSLGLTTNISDPHMSDVLIYTTGKENAVLLKNKFMNLYGKIYGLNIQEVQ